MNYKARVTQNKYIRKANKVCNKQKTLPLFPAYSNKSQASDYTESDSAPACLFCTVSECTKAYSRFRVKTRRSQVDFLWHTHEDNYSGMIPDTSWACHLLILENADLTRFYLEKILRHFFR